MSTSRLLLLFLIQPIGGFLIGLSAGRKTNTYSHVLILTAIALIAWIALVNLICFKGLQ